MFTQQELIDLRTAFDAVSMGQAFVNIMSLKVLFTDMGIFPSDEMLQDLLSSVGKVDNEDAISFDLFARSVALLLEENAEKGSTSSQQNHNEQMGYEDDGEEMDQEQLQAQV